MIKLYPSVSAPAQIYGTPKMHKSPLVIHSLNFVQLFHLQVLLIVILPVSFLIFFHLQFLMITFAKILFLLIINFYFYNVTSLFTNISLQGTIDIAINLIFNHNPDLNITKKELKKTFYGIIGVHSPPSKILAPPPKFRSPLYTKAPGPPLIYLIETLAISDAHINVF